jgi:serine/threonine-protein kinase
MGGRFVRSAFASVVSFALLASASPSAHAQNAANQATAEALFDAGKKLMAAHKYGEACPKFYESNQLDEGIGTSLWLADCYEKNGQSASAWAEFRQAAALAAKVSDPREKVARARAKALEPGLSRLTVVVPASSLLPGLRVARDGGDVAQPIWGTEVPIDPGPHTVVVSAPDHRPATLQVDIHRGPSHATLEVPLLEEAPEPPAAEAAVPAAGTTPPAAEPPRFPVQRALAIGAGAAGVVSVALGGYFGLSAKSDLGNSNAGHCNAKDMCDPAGLADRASAESAATASTVLFIAGGVAVAGGIALWLTAPTSASAAPSPSMSAVVSRVFPFWDPHARSGGVVLTSDF